jgi:hypothetical protein
LHNALLHFLSVKNIYNRHIKINMFKFWQLYLCCNLCLVPNNFTINKLFHVFLITAQKKRMLSIMRAARCQWTNETCYKLRFILMVSHQLLKLLRQCLSEWSMIAKHDYISLDQIVLPQSNHIYRPQYSFTPYAWPQLAYHQLIWAKRVLITFHTVSVDDFPYTYTQKKCTKVNLF